jgi:BirA family biotin operon repressor/biotin-[acetyl-CoA-carboxylase] ligase
MSIILRPCTDVRGALPVTLVAATSVAVVLSKLLDVETQVEWPNDVVMARGKIAGILAESSARTTGLAHLVLGIGINVNARAHEFPPDMPYPAASCFTLTGAEWNRADIAADVLGTIEAYYDRFLRDGFGPLRSAYESRLRHLGARVGFERDGERIHGAVLGVAADGALRVALDGGEEATLYSETIEVDA